MKKFDGDPKEYESNYKLALERGILKVMSKMGISTVASYTGSQIFEIIGIDEDTTKLNSPKIIDAENCLVCPGLIDLSVRFREPGLEKEATIQSESRAAVSSGVTTVCYMPDTQPVIDTPAQIKLVENIFENIDLCKVKVLASLTKGLDGKNLSPMMELKQAGAIGLTNCFKTIDNSLMRAMFISLCVFSITFAASATLMLDALNVPAVIMLE